MKQSTCAVLFLTIWLGAGVPNLSAEPPAWKIDKDHTNFYFSVTHIYSEVHGRFTDFTGTMLFAPDNLEESSLSFEIKAKSVDTGLGKRDKHLRSDDFLHTSKFPLITFVSKGFVEVGKNMINVTGTLTIKDVSQDIILPLSFAGISDHPFEKNTLVAGFNGRLTIDRLAYGVGSGKYYDIGAVGKDVSILVTTELLRKK